MQFAKRMSHLKASEIRDLLKLTEKPEMIAFAGGMPAPELFRKHPFAMTSLTHQPEKPYYHSEGYGLSHENSERIGKLAQLIRINFDYPHRFAGLDFTGRLFLDEGTVVLCESPTYLAAINAFRAYMPRFVEMPTDSQGVIPEALEKILQEVENIRLIYVIPDFQNPTGNSWSLQRRKAFMDIVSRYEIPVLEDNPYGELRYEGEHLPSLLSMDKKGQVVYTGTFSKILCPGFRIGWLAAREDIIRRYALLKQGADLHTGIATQLCVNQILEHFDLEAHIEQLQRVYRSGGTMLEAVKEYLPGCWLLHR